MVTDWSNNLASGGLKATKALNFLTTDSFTRKLRFEKILKFGPTLCEEKSLASQIVSNQYAHPFFRFLLKPQRRCTRKKWFDKTHNTLFSIFILVKEKNQPNYYLKYNETTSGDVDEKTIFEKGSFLHIINCVLRNYCKIKIS